MTYFFIFEDDYSRIMFSCIVDARATIPAIKNQVGTVIKSYVDNQVALVDNNSIVYKIETDQGVMAGYFVIKVNTTNKTAFLHQFVVRPSFTQFILEIQSQISNFITSNKWQSDYLF